MSGGESAGDVGGDGSAAAPQPVAVDGIRLLTGLVGVIWYTTSWLFAAVPVLLIGGGIYFYAVTAAPSVPLLIAGLAVAEGVVVLCWAIARWVARGVLEGRKGWAVVGCLLMIVFSILAVLGAMARKNPQPSEATTAVLQAMLAVVFAMLLIGSFRNRLYWKGGR